MGDLGLMLAVMLGIAFVTWGIVWLAYRDNSGPSLIIEPLETLITGWQIARFEPNSEVVKVLFKALCQTHLSSGSLLETLLSQAGSQVPLRSKGLNFILLEQEAIAPLGLRLMVENGPKTQSIVIGPAGQIDSWIEDEQVSQAHHLSLQAAEHGFLALTIAVAAVHGPGKRSNRHRYAGMIILEPVLKRGLTSAKPLRFLTVLPYQFAHHLYGRLFPQANHFGLNAAELETLEPRYAEADLAKAVVVGSADLAARHRVLQSWQKDSADRYVSLNPEDRGLPTPPITEFS